MRTASTKLAAAAGIGGDVTATAESSFAAPRAARAARESRDDGGSTKERREEQSRQKAAAEQRIWKVKIAELEEQQVEAKNDLLAISTRCPSD